MKGADFGLAVDMRAVTCPACGYHVAVPFYDGGAQPLATLAWPASIAEARSMSPLPLAFDSRAVPYSDKPNLMFNSGLRWTGHLRSMRQAMLERLTDTPSVVEIGHGDASFLAALSRTRPHG